jgi:hypothetical protein
MSRVVLLGSKGFLGRGLVKALRVPSGVKDLVAISGRNEVSAFLQEERFQERVVIICCCFDISFESINNSASNSNRKLTIDIIEFLRRNNDASAILYSAAGNLTWLDEKSNKIEVVRVPKPRDLGSLRSVSYFRDICERDIAIESSDVSSRVAIIYCSNIVAEGAEQIKRVASIIDSSHYLMLVPGGRTAFVTLSLIADVTNSIIERSFISRQTKGGSLKIVLNQNNSSFEEVFREAIRLKAIRRLIVTIKIPGLALWALQLMLPSKTLLLSAFQVKTYPVYRRLTTEQILGAGRL